MTKGFLLAFLAAFSWGASIVLSKAGLEQMDAGTLFFFQILSATLLSWVVLLISRNRLMLNRPALWAYATGIFEPFLAYILTLYGLEKVPAGAASVIFSLESAMILILSVLILKVKVKSAGTFILLLVGALAGSLLVVFPETGNPRGSFSGYLLIFAGVLSAAFCVVISSRLVKSMNPLQLLTGQLTYAAILAPVFLFFSGASLRLPKGAVLLVISSGTMQYFLAFVLYLYSLKWVEVHIAGVMLYFVPVIALLLSWVFLDETLSAVQAAGVVLTIGSVFFLSRKYEH
ncbi:DMT family transporter [Mycoavidus sp. SF9855]|uniref:DMT family transporter n=1 Tax=Mycoavidus sp. SF9855 TaxID=2968475 RepID=UPI00211BCF68|nr:DMT family transporter [Mycoavidus sp. SF9855]UUM20828.1 DMT family transporter [Mycoavidus sp. SF9855]